MTWLFTQVWLWSLAAFLLGSVFTWLLFVLPMRRRLNAITAEYAHRPPAYTAHPYNSESQTTLDLFEAPRALGGSAEAAASQAEFPGPGRWEPLTAARQEQLERTVAHSGGGLTELPSLPTWGGPPAPSLGVPAEQAAPMTGSDGRNIWFDESEPGELAPPDSPEPVVVPGAPAEQAAEPAARAAEEPEHRVSPYVPPPDSEVTQVIPRMEDGQEDGAESAAPSEQFTIKGHFASRQYHTPESPQYDRIVAEVWFRTVEDAEQAGFEHWNARPAS